MPGASTAPARIAARSEALSAAATHDAPSPAAPEVSSGRSALESPPAAGRTPNEPSAFSTNRYGPRFETTTVTRHQAASSVGISSSASSGSGWPSRHGWFERAFAEIRQQPEPVRELPGREEVRSDVLLALRAHRVGANRVGEQVDHPRCTLLDRVDEIAVEPIAYLELDAAGAPADDGTCLPESLADRQPEPFTDRLLHHDRRDALERVDLHRPDLVQVRQEEDVAVAGALPFDLLPDAEAFGVVGRHRSRHQQLRVGHLLAYDAEGLQHANRILPRVEAADLTDDRAIRVHAVLPRELHTEGHGQLEVLHRQRIDARWCVHHTVHLERSGHELGHGPYRCVVQLDERPEELPDHRVGRRQVDVTPPDPLRARARRRGSIADEVEERSGLWVVDDDEVVLALEEERVVEKTLEVLTLHLRRPVDVGALQCVVDLLRGGEELVAAVQHLPFRFETDATEQGHVRREELRDTTSVSGRVDVEHACSAHRRRERPNALHRLVADDGGVVTQIPLEERDTLEHRQAPSAGERDGRHRGQSIQSAPRDRVS